MKVESLIRKLSTVKPGTEVLVAAENGGWSPHIFLYITKKKKILLQGSKKEIKA